MKNFILKLFISIPLILILTIGIYYIHHPNWSIGYEVEEAKNTLITAETNLNDTVRIGDSVGKNFFGTQADSNGINLCASAGVSILGHTMLLNKFLERSPKKNWFIHGYFRPSSLMGNLQSQYTNNYFIKKFYNNQWLFNRNIVPSEVAYYVDSVFLKKHHPYKQMIRYTWMNEFSVFFHPQFGNNEEPQSSDVNKSIIQLLLNSELKSLLTKIHFKSVPIHPELYEAEYRDYKILRSLGLHIDPPIITDATYFIKDKTHMIPELRNPSSYYKIVSNN